MISSSKDITIPHAHLIFAEIEKDPILKTLGGMGAYIAGGYATALLLAPRANGVTDHAYYQDIDLYFERLADYARGYNWAMTQKWDRTHITERALTLVQGDQTYQIIRQVSSAEHLLSTFDLENCKVAMVPSSQVILFSREGVKATAAKELVLNKIQHLPSTLNRILKYKTRWGLTLSEKLIGELRLLRKYHPVLMGYAWTGPASGDFDPVADRPTENIWERFTDIRGLDPIDPLDNSFLSQDTILKAREAKMYPW